MPHLRTLRGRTLRAHTERWVYEEWARVQAYYSDLELTERGVKLERGWHECRASGCGNLVKQEKQPFCRDRACQSRRFLGGMSSDIQDAVQAKLDAEELAGLIEDQAREIRLDNRLDNSKTREFGGRSRRASVSLDEPVGYSNLSDNTFHDIVAGEGAPI